MKTYGAILIIIGVAISIIGFGMYANVGCHCPAQITSKSNCHCGESLHSTGHIITYFGFGITGIGIILFVHGWRQKLLFN